MRIGTVAAETGLTTKTIRFYEQAGLLPEPPRNANGYRDYASSVLDRLAFIRDAQAAGLTLAEIRSVLAIRESGQPPCRHVTGLIETHLAQVDERIAELLQARSGLEALRQRAQATYPAACDADGICVILMSS